MGTGRPEQAAFRPSAPLRRRPQPRPGAGWAEGGAFRPPFRSPGQRNAVSRMRSVHRLRKKDGTDQTVCWCRDERGDHGSRWRFAPAVSKPAIGGKGVPTDGLIDCTGPRAGRDVTDEQRPVPGVPRRDAARADERCSHAVRHRGGYVAGEIVADEQHRFSGASGRRQHRVVEDGSGLPVDRTSDLVPACF